RARLRRRHPVGHRQQRAAGRGLRRRVRPARRGRGARRVTPALVAGLGLLIGLALGSLGGAGSVLAGPVVAHLAGQPAAAATATSLVAVGASAAGAAGRHARAGRVRWGVAAVFVAVGVPGSWAGAELNGRLAGETLLVGLSVLALVAAPRMLTACPAGTRVGAAAAVGAAAPARPARGAPRRAAR